MHLAVARPIPFATARLGDLQNSLHDALSVCDIPQGPHLLHSAQAIVRLGNFFCYYVLQRHFLGDDFLLYMWHDFFIHM